MDLVIRAGELAMTNDPIMMRSSTFKHYCDLAVQIVYSIDNYTLYYSYGNINNVDGVAIYVRNDVVHKTSITEYDSFKVLNCTVFLKGSESILVMAIYRCHDFSKTDFINVIKKIIKNMEKNHIIAGDYNINILSNEPKPEELSNECLSHGYLPLFNSITIPNENDGTCIANFYAKSPIDLKAIKHSQVFADHYPLFCDFNIIKPSTNRIDYFHKLNINCYRRKLWNYINNKLGKNCKTECPVKKIKFNDNTIEDADIIANHFNDFFSNIGLELANKIRSSNPAGSNYHSISNRNSRSVYLWPVTSTELQTVISDMKNKNGGSDNIHSRVLKIISHIISPVLTEIFNDCIEMDIWPSSLKQDDVVPIFKSATWEQAQRSMSVKLKALNDWFVKNELTLNITKTEHVTFGWYANSVPQNTEIIVGGRQVGRTNVTKYLGIFMDFNLKWDYHIHYPM
ncbi:hypothetical protein TKK_0018294 [Trichogramma kaykai]